MNDDAQNIETAGESARGFPKMNRLERAAAKWIVGNTKGATRRGAHGVLRHYGHVIAGTLAAVGVAGFAATYTQFSDEPEAVAARQQKVEDSKIARVVHSMLDQEEKYGVSEVDILGPPNSFWPRERYLSVSFDKAGTVLCHSPELAEVMMECSDLAASRKAVVSLEEEFGFKASDIPTQPVELTMVDGTAICSVGHEFHVCADAFTQEWGRRAQLSCLDKINSTYNWGVEPNQVVMFGNKRGRFVFMVDEYDIIDGKFEAAAQSPYAVRVRKCMSEYPVAPLRKLPSALAAG